MNKLAPIGTASFVLAIYSMPLNRFGEGKIHWGTAGRLFCPRDGGRALALPLDDDARAADGLEPAGVVLDAPPVRTADGQVYWRLKAEAPGDYALSIQVGNETLEKTWAVGGDPRKIPVKRLRSWEALLYPGEPAIPSSSPVQSIELATRNT